MIDLMDEQYARTLVRERLDNREWWILPWVSDVSGDISALIETSFYDGEASADFEIVFGSANGVMMTTSFAHKRRMSREQYAELLASGANLSGDAASLAASLVDQDIVMSIAGPDDLQGYEYALLWHAWVMGDDGWKPAEAT